MKPSISSDWKQAKKKKKEKGKVSDLIEGESKGKREELTQVEATSSKSSPWTFGNVDGRPSGVIQPKRASLDLRDWVLLAEDDRDEDELKEPYVKDEKGWEEEAAAQEEEEEEWLGREER